MLNLSIKEIKWKQIIDATLCRRENKFVAFANLHKLLNILRTKFSYISNVKYRNIISTFMKKVNNKIQYICQKNVWLREASRPSFQVNPKSLTI